MSELMNPDPPPPVPRFVAFTAGTFDLSNGGTNVGGALNLTKEYQLADFDSDDDAWDPARISDIELRVWLDSDSAAATLYYTFPDGVERDIGDMDNVGSIDDRSAGFKLRLPVHPDQGTFKLRAVLEANTATGGDSISWVIFGAIVHPEEAP
jgi:hypothetical protein